MIPAHRSEMTDEEYEKTFDPIDDIIGRWDLDRSVKTEDEVERFLEESGYYDWHGI